MTTRNHERMSSVDTAWLRMDGPGNSMMIVGVSATETPVRPADFRRMIEQRLLCFTRFRQRPGRSIRCGNPVPPRRMTVAPLRRAQYREYI